MDSILIVDDNIDTRENISELFAENGYKTYTSGDGKSAIYKIRKYNPNCVILDMKLPVMDGWQVLENIQTEIRSGMIVINITAYGEVSTAVKAMKMGAYDFIEKPFNNEVLLLIVSRALSSQKVKKELNNLRRSLGETINGEEIFGKSEAIKKILKQIDIVAPTDITVLIQGETGSGKEVIANYIHRISNRNKFPFVALDCGAIPETLIESELFGFEKGSFTGAYKRNKGKFEIANQGTLFLDEIGNFPLQHQRRLLRVVEQKKISPIGSDSEIEIHTRLIVASNKDLQRLVDEGNFRKDLFYRLTEFVINVPPLHERVEDIPHLVNIFIQEANKEIDRNVSEISNKAMKYLLNYTWPGNVRQLRNVIRKAVLLASNKILPQHINLPCKDIYESRISETTRFSLEKYSSFKNALKDISSDIEKELINRAVSEANGNLTKAAKIFGIDRKTFYRKIEKYKIKIFNEQND